MKIENYIFHYDEKGVCINKLILKTFEDVKAYVADFVKTQFVAQTCGNVVKFISDGTKVEYNVECF